MEFWRDGVLYSGRTFLSANRFGLVRIGSDFSGSFCRPFYWPTVAAWRVGLEHCPLPMGEFSSLERVGAGKMLRQSGLSGFENFKFRSGVARKLADLEIRAPLKRLRPEEFNARALGDGLGAALLPVPRDTVWPRGVQTDPLYTRPRADARK